MLNALFPFHAVLLTTLDVQGGGLIVGILTDLQIPHLALSLPAHTPIALDIFSWLLGVGLF